MQVSADGWVEAEVVDELKANILREMQETMKVDMEAIQAQFKLLRADIEGVTGFLEGMKERYDEDSRIRGEMKMIAEVTGGLREAHADIQQLKDEMRQLKKDIDEGDRWTEKDLSDLRTQLIILKGSASTTSRSPLGAIAEGSAGGARIGSSHVAPQLHNIPEPLGSDCWWRELEDCQHEVISEMTFTEDEFSYVKVSRILRPEKFPPAANTLMASKVVSSETWWGALQSSAQWGDAAAAHELRDVIARGVRHPGPHTTTFLKHVCVGRDYIAYGTTTNRMFHLHVGNGSRGQRIKDADRKLIADRLANFFNL